MSKSLKIIFSKTSIFSPSGKFSKFAALAVTAFILVFGSNSAALAKPFPKAPNPDAQSLKACPEYGPGFFRLPDSATCVKVGGRIRIDTGAGSKGDRRSDINKWQTEGRLDLDARLQDIDGRVVIRMKGVRNSN